MITLSHMYQIIKPVYFLHIKCYFIVLILYHRNFFQSVEYKIKCKYGDKEIFKSNVFKIIFIKLINCGIFSLIRFNPCSYIKCNMKTEGT